MSKLLAVRQFVRTCDGHVYCVDCSFNLPEIINAGYAPDDVIDFVINRCVVAHMMKEQVKDVHKDEN
jgi:hypothetical protein